MGPVTTISADCRIAGLEVIFPSQCGCLAGGWVATDLEHIQLLVLLAVFSHGESRAGLAPALLVTKQQEDRGGQHPWAAWQDDASGKASSREVQH